VAVRTAQDQGSATAREVGMSAPTERTGAIAVERVVKCFGDVVAVDHVSFELQPGTFSALLGPSGCGKTTLLRMIAGFEQPTDGAIVIGGVPMQGVPSYQRPVNTVFQHYALFPHMTVAGNVGYALRQQRPRPARSEISSRVDASLAMVRLEGYGARRISELSGGQQQRVALARALISRPEVLLLDEPLSALDAKLRHEMQLEIKQLQQQVGITFLFVTHDQEEAMSMADRVLVMRDGQVLQDDSPERIYDEPVDTFVADFVGTSNVFRGEVTSTDGDGVVMLRCADAELVGTCGDASLILRHAAALVVRPERIELGHRDDAMAPHGRPTTSLAGRVVARTFLGDHVAYLLDVPPLGAVRVTQPRRGPGSVGLHEPGHDVALRWSADAGRVIPDVVQAGGATPAALERTPVGGNR
jgi:spermidine/putrescine transport system ATP-binding protein